MNPSTLLPSAWEHVALASLQGALLIVVVALVQRLLKSRLGPAWSFSLWFLVLLRLSSPSLPVSTWSWQRLADVLSAKASLVVPSAAIPGFPSDSSSLDRGSALSADSPVVASPSAWVNNSISPFGPNGSSTSEPYGAASEEQRPMASWGFIWAVGALVLLARQWLGAWVFGEDCAGGPNSRTES